jgi:hypothetical protein
MAPGRRPSPPRCQSAGVLDEAETDVLAYMSFPVPHRAKLHSTDKIDKRFGLPALAG